VGPRAGLDDVEERKILLLPGFEPKPSSPYIYIYIYIYIYRITSNIRCTFYTFFPVEKLSCVLNSRNVHLSN
jgi:hypothetical protein